MYPQTTSSKKKRKKKGIPLPSNFRKCSFKPSQLPLAAPGCSTCHHMLNSQKNMQHFFDYFYSQTTSGGQYYMEHTLQTLPL